MVKPKFENLDVEAWICPRKLGISQPSLCLFHPSKQVGSPLLDVIDELQVEGYPSKRTLTFRSSQRPREITTLRLQLVPESDELRVMNIASDASVATIQMTEAGLWLIRHAIVIWLGGAEDFGVSSRHSSLRPFELGQFDHEPGELWFWGPGYVGP